MAQRLIVMDHESVASYGTGLRLFGNDNPAQLENGVYITLHQRRR